MDKTRQSFKSEIKFAFSLVYKSAKMLIFWQCIISLLNAVIAPLFSIGLVKLVIMLLEDGSSLDRIAVFTAIAVALKIITFFIESLYDNKLKPLYSLDLSRHICHTLYEKALSLDLARYESAEFQDKYYKAIENAQTKVETVITNTIQFVGNLLSVVLVMAYVVYIDPLLLLLIVIPLATTLMFKVSSKIRYELEMENSELKRQMEYVNRVAYSKDYAMELRISDIFAVLKGKYDDASKKIKKNYSKYGKILVWISMVTTFMLTTLTLLASYLYLGWRYIFRGDVLLSDFAVVVSAVVSMNYKISNMLKNIYALQETRFFIENIQMFLAEEPDISTNENGARVDPNNDFTINFNNVSFRYTENGEDVLKNIDLTITKGEKIAIVGTNGSGKSTLIKLLLRLYDAASGEISINGVDIKSCSLDSYRKMFLPVFQDYKTFAGTIEDNIKMGSASCGDIYDAIKKAGLEEYVLSLKNGLRTQVTREFDDDGIVLSGGQRQKLALARGFASNANIIIFDEPSASLDPESEYRLFENIYRELEDKTVIFISHRLTSTVMADRVIMLDDGYIRECGTHSELLRRDGAYSKMYHIQAEAYGGNGV